MGDKVCQQTLTGLYHNEVSVLEELRGWPANRPPQRVHIPTGQGLRVICVCVYVCSSTFGMFMLGPIWRVREKAAILSVFSPSLHHSPPASCLYTV